MGFANGAGPSRPTSRLPSPPPSPTRMTTTANTSHAALARHPVTCGAGRAHARLGLLLMPVIRAPSARAGQPDAPDAGWVSVRKAPYLAKGTAGATTRRPSKPPWTPWAPPAVASCTFRREATWCARTSRCPRDVPRWHRQGPDPLQGEGPDPPAGRRGRRAGRRHGVHSRCRAELHAAGPEGLLPQPGDRGRAVAYPWTVRGGAGDGAALIDVLGSGRHPTMTS